MLLRKMKESGKINWTIRTIFVIYLGKVLTNISGVSTLLLPAFCMVLIILVKENMRKLIVLTFVSMDGVMQAPGGPEEDPEGKFTQGGWTVGYWDQVMNDVMTEQMGHPFDLVLGRKTYEIFAGYWPTSKEPGADVLNQAKKYVASRTLKNLTWVNSVLLTGDTAAEIKKIKNQDGPELQVHGSSNLIQTLLKNDLVDEFWLKIFPLTIGSGKRLYGDGTIPASFKLIKSQSSPNSVLIATYVRDGDIKRGSFGA